MSFWKSVFNLLFTIACVGVLASLAQAQDEQKDEQKQGQKDEKKELSDFAKNFVGVWKYDPTKTRNALKNVGIDSRASKSIINEQRVYMLTMHDDGTFEFRITRDLNGTGKWTIYEPAVEGNSGKMTLIFDENEEIPVNVMQLHFEFEDTMRAITLRPEKKNSFVMRRIRKTTEKGEKSDDEEQNDDDGDGDGDGGDRQ